ncbi:MAG TPA: carboxypeptidase-like regulatory domain-containing protein, partial [Bacteroidetes bacterium]|nr:carboxypeptidase-like regulatory domain-containing protein [Bacteroidota bacterium]
MKRLLLFFICFSLFFVHSLYGQTTGKISGTAIDLQTEKPVAKVLIKLQGTKYSQFSDANGKFSFPDLPAGTYHLIAIKGEYYITVVPKIQLGSGRTAIVKVEMIVGVADRYVHMALGGVTVTEDRLLVPENYQTV